MTHSVVVRAARAEDKANVLAFCQNTWSWGDYIAEVWDDWLTYPHGQLIVGLVDNHPVGVLHVALIDDSAWMEGLRVHPDFRRKGVASAMDRAGRAFARERGCRTARLATGINNTAGQRSFESLSYRRVAQFNEWETEMAAADFSNWRIANEDDTTEIMAQWNHSTIRLASYSLIPNSNWRWTELTEERLHEKIRSSQVHCSEHGFAILAPSFDSTLLNFHLLVGDNESLVPLAIESRGEAHSRGYEHLEAMLADHPGLNAALARAGYQRGDGIFIYEQEL